MAILNVTKKDDGKTLSIGTGSEIVLSLPENPTTGFRWQLDDFDGKILHSVDSRFEAGSDAAGAAGVRLFHFKAGAEGETKLPARLWRKWEGDASVTERFEVTLKVTR